MQTPKARNGSSEVPQKASPVTPRTARQLKINPESDSASGTPASRTPKDRSPKVVTRSPRSPVTEKKRPSRLSELESQVAKLHEDLKAAKDQLESSESCKNHAQQEAEEAKKRLTVLNVKLEESQCRFLALSAASEKAQHQQLQKISQVQDQSWQSELDSLQKQHSVDAAALISAMDEIERLKIQLDRTADSEANQTMRVEITRAEIQSLNSDLEKTLAQVENLNSQLKDCKESEAQAQARFNETLLQFESVKATAELLQADGIKAMEAYGFLCSELEKSKLQINSLEELVSQLQVDLVNARRSNSGNPSGAADEYTQEVGDGKVGETTKFQTEVNSMKFDVEHLGSALEAAELRYQEEQIRSSMEIHKAYELVEQTKSEASSREAALESELKKTNDHVDELKATLMEKETELQNVSDENKCLKIKIVNNLSSERISEVEMDLKKSNADVVDLKASLMDKETELQSISEENEMLKSEFKKREMERVKANEETIAEVEAARAAEQEALMKLTYVKEQADESSRRAVRVTEQLEAAQASNSEMDAELRRLKVQADQWRKAAEAAAAVLSTGNNGKYMDRSGSLDSNYHPVTGKLCSPYSEDMDDDSPKKKNNNVLKKIGVLWKKGNK